MSNPVIQDTQLECNKGTTKTPLQVNSQTFSKIAGKLVATEADKQASVNIIPFGECKLKPKRGGYLPCVPALIKWKNTPNFTLNGKKQLTTDSYCMCSTGGKVTPLVDSNSSFKSIDKTS